MSRWPADNQNALIKFYGNPGTGEVAKQLVPYVPPFKMYFDGTPVKHLLIHRKCVAAFASAFDKIWDYYGKDQKVIDSLRISHTAGTYCKRMIRGSTTRWSNHAFGGALDLDAENNGFNAKSSIPMPVIAAFKSEGMRWGGDYTGRKDPMHFECCQGRDPDRTFEEWLNHYGMPRYYGPPVGVWSDGDTGETADVPANGVVVENTDVDDNRLPESESRYTDTELSAAPAAKSLLKSKISWVMQALGLGGSGAVITSDSGLQTTFTQLVTNPRFLWVVIIVVLVGAGLYFYWHDHGKGSQR